MNTFSLSLDHTVCSEAVLWVGVGGQKVEVHISLIHLSLAPTSHPPAMMDLLERNESPRGH